MAVFKSPSIKLTGTGTVYTTPASGAIIIGLQASNVSDGRTLNINVWIERGSEVINIVGTNSQAFPQTALTIGAGKIVLQSGDIVKAESGNADSDNYIDLIVSIMEF